MYSKLHLKRLKIVKKAAFMTKFWPQNIAQKVAISLGEISGKKIAPIGKKNCPNGEISPNLVTLGSGSSWLNIQSSGSARARKIWARSTSTRANYVYYPFSARARRFLLRTAQYPKIWSPIPLQIEIRFISCNSFRLRVEGKKIKASYKILLEMTILISTQ